jgi:hypothetical protein
MSGQGAYCYALPPKTANKQNAKVKLKTNANFMALWKTNFTTENEDLCATRILEAWDEPNYCPNCIQPAGFGHVCRPNDRHIQSSVAKVKQTMTNTTMLNDIIEADQPHTSSTEANTSTTIDSSFFFHAGGQEEDSYELTEIHQHGDEDDQDYEEQDREEKDHYENDDNYSDRNTENSDQDNEEYNNSDQEFSDNDPPYDSDGEGSNEDD